MCFYCHLQSRDVTSLIRVQNSRKTSFFTAHILRNGEGNSFTGEVSVRLQVGAGYPLVLSLVLSGEGSALGPIQAKIGVQVSALPGQFVA